MYNNKKKINVLKLVNFYGVDKFLRSLEKGRGIIKFDQVIHKNFIISQSNANDKWHTGDIMELNASDLFSVGICQPILEVSPVHQFYLVCRWFCGICMQFEEKVLLKAVYTGELYTDLYHLKCFYICRIKSKIDHNF